ncbi:Transcription-silencing protein Clr2 domain containing protein [Hyaloscypha variabilis]
MAPYFPLICHRTDGQFEVATRNGAKEVNQPTAEQMNDTPDANGNVDCYKKLEIDEAKHVDWRRKLGGMLMHLLGGKEHADRNYILREFPDGYVLWEHVKYNVAKAAAESKKEKGKHAAGVFERQDAYLYGHPQGRKKRFRSPADFFPHLLWLMTDQEGDPMNCSCKICSPDGDEDPTAFSGKSEVKNLKLNPPTLSAAPPQTIPNYAPSSSISAPSAPSAPPPQAAAQVSPPTGSKEQAADASPSGKYIYRPGELVWFNNIANWRLGVVAKRGLKNNKPRYLIQPLSNPHQQQNYQLKDDENLLRPWLAWSTPETTVVKLFNNVPFDQVPWDRVVRSEFDQPGKDSDHIVDGSILAAKVIDASYSLFERNEKALVSPGEVHYMGMFLGAEKIWVGEPVRLRVTTSDYVVLIIHKLVEKTTPQGGSTVTFIGDVYKFVEMPTPYKNPSDWPNNPDLPPRMSNDLRYRNEVAHLARTGMWYEWRLLEPAARKSLADIKGRWYETRTLVPIIHPAEFQADLEKGRTKDADKYMNGRRDNNAVPEQRKKNRRDTLGQAVPMNFKVSRGLDGPPADDAFPDEQPQVQPQQQQPQQQRPQQGTFNNDISQYMNLDQADHGYYGSEMQQ